jgi:RNA polymerase sigma factor for flagellar operon FliA
MAKHPCRTRTPLPPLHNDPALDHQGLIRMIAWDIFSRIPKHASIEISDLVQAGHLGLLRARRSYRPESKVQFATYARYRIRGEILDVLRRLDNAPRSLRRWQRAVDAKIRELSGSLHRMPTDEELGDALGLDVVEVRRNRYALWTLSGENEVPPRVKKDISENQRSSAAAPDWMPDVIQERKESVRILLDSVSSLPARSQQVILLYYQQDFTMKQIGAILQVNESRVSQIHKTALRSMSMILRSAGIRSAPVFKFR